MTAAAFLLSAGSRAKAVDKKDVNRCIRGGLDWLANTQSRLGHWTANDGRYPTAMTALAGMALCRRLDHDAGQVLHRTSAGRSIICSAAAAPTA